MMGSAFAANLSAASLLAAAPSLAARACFGPPSFFPRSLAAASAAFVRELINSRSCSATAARMWMVSLFACGSDVHLTAYQIGCEVGQSVGLVLRPAILDRHILALDVAGLAHSTNALVRWGHAWTVRSAL